MLKGVGSSRDLLSPGLNPLLCELDQVTLLSHIFFTYKKADGNTKHTRLLLLKTDTWIGHSSQDIAVPTPVKIRNP